MAFNKIVVIKYDCINTRGSGMDKLTVCDNAAVLTAHTSES